MPVIVLALILSPIIQNAATLSAELSRRNLVWSIVSIQRHADYLYVNTLTSPSAGRLLVLSQTLDFKRELDGWPVLMLDDGRVVFQRSMVHWAPAHAGVLALYDPKMDRESNLYPAAPAGNFRGVEPVRNSRYLFIDRSFFDVKQGHAPATIEFVTIVQRIRLDRGEPRAHGAASARRSIVTCDLSRPKPSCRERSAPRD
jgi:hypothetical protein